jgi:hypothetical protein
MGFVFLYLGDLEKIQLRHLSSFILIVPIGRTKSLLERRHPTLAVNTVLN